VNAKHCICDIQSNRLENTHNDKRNINLMLTTKKDDEGIIIFERGRAIATFDIKFCPMCGKEL
jgi:hypothetical protein